LFPTNNSIILNNSKKNGNKQCGKSFGDRKPWLLKGSKNAIKEKKIRKHHANGFGTFAANFGSKKV
jgi:hypothetical protein